MQRARHEPRCRRRRLPQDYDDEPEYEPAPVHPLHRYAAPARRRRRRSTDRSAQAPQTMRRSADTPTSHADPSRYDDALYGRLETGEQDYQRDPAYPDDPYAYQDGYEEEPAPKKRSQRPDDGCRGAGAGRGRDRRCLCLSHLCRFAPQRRAADHQGRQQPDQGGAGAIRCGAAKTPDRMLPGDGGEKLVSREEAPVDVNSRSGGRAWCFRR